MSLRGRALFLAPDAVRSAACPQEAPATSASVAVDCLHIPQG